MASAYLRANNNNSNNMYRNGNNNSYGSKDQQAKEANITLMELENNAKWVRYLPKSLIIFRSV
jgi:hypothetical protein